jgi:hypothetical protein
MGSRGQIRVSGANFTNHEGLKFRSQQGNFHLFHSCYCNTDCVASERCSLYVWRVAANSYTEAAVADIRQGVVLQLEAAWRSQKVPMVKTNEMLRKVRN